MIILCDYRWYDWLSLDKVLQIKVQQLPPRAVDVLMAPHHGSKKSLPPEFLDWCQPATLVIGTQGDIYPSMPLNSASKWMSTREEGAITLRFHKSGIAIQTFMNGKGAGEGAENRF